MSSELITPATYSGVHVLQQADSYGQPVMRRAKDDYINATQILRAAGFPKTQRTKILERDISGGVHEKVQGGFHMFQGTWVPLETGVKLARKHGVEELLTPLFEFTLTDGLNSDIFKNMGKFGKPYRGPVRPRVEARPSSQRIASTSVAALIFDDSSEDDEDLGALDFDDDEDEDENDADDDDTRKRRVTRAAAAPPASGDLEQSSNNNNASSSDDNGETPPPADRKLNPVGASSSNITASFTPQPSRKQTNPPSPKSTPTYLPVPSGTSIALLPPGAQSPVVKRGPGRPKGSKNRASSASPAPHSPRTSTRRLESVSPEKDARGGAYQSSSRSGSVNGASSRREPRSSRLKESSMRQSMTAGRRDDEMEGKEGQDAEMAADAARKRRVDDVRDLMDPYGLLRRRRGSLSSTMEGEFGDEEDAQRWEDEEGFRGWDEIALGLFAPAVAAEEEEEEMRGRSRAGRIGGATIPTTDEAWAYPVSDEASTRGSRFGGTSSTVKKRSVLVSDMEGNGDHKKQKLIGGISFKRVFACGLCGVLTKRHSLWKRRVGSGGSRSVAHIRLVCNSCGLKACFGRTSGDHERVVLDDDSDNDDVEVSESSWKRDALATGDLAEESSMAGSVSPEEQELRRLKRVLDRRLRDSKRLKILLEALRAEDANVDRGFRRAIVWCRQVKQGIFYLESREREEKEGCDDEDVDGVDGVGWGQQVLDKFISRVTTSHT